MDNLNNKAHFELDNKTKSTYFSLLIYDLNKKIEEYCDEWLLDVFYEKKDIRIF